jgi:hypothetical protein
MYAYLQPAISSVIEEDLVHVMCVVCFLSGAVVYLIVTEVNMFQFKSQLLPCLGFDKNANPVSRNPK